MNTGTAPATFLLFRSHGRDPLSLLIRLLTWSKYVHAAVLDWEPGSGAIRPCIIESYWPHVRRRELRASELSQIDVFIIDAVALKDLAAADSWLYGQVYAKTPYDVRDLFLFAPLIRGLLNIVGLGESKLDPDKSRTFCSMLVFNWARKMKRPLLNCRDIQAAPGYLAWSTAARFAGPLDQWLDAQK